MTTQDPMQQVPASAQALTPEQQAAQQAAIMQQQDPLRLLRQDLQAQRTRLKQYLDKRLQSGAIPNGSELHMLYVEIDGTVLSMMDTIVHAVHATRDHLFNIIVQNDTNARVAFDDMLARVEAIEEPETQFTQEDADKFVYVCQAAHRLAEICRDNPKNDRKELDKIVATSQECLKIIEETTLVSDPDDEDEDAQPSAGQA